MPFEMEFSMQKLYRSLPYMLSFPISNFELIFDQPHIWMESSKGKATSLVYHPLNLKKVTQIFIVPDIMIIL